MTVARFAWQREKVQQHPGLVLNVGCNEDPANLKDERPAEVINVDLEAVDSHLGRANRVDVLLDAAKERWPWEDGDVALVVLGDILEHLLPDEAKSVLTEARRVAQRVAITVPEDGRREILGQDAPEGNPYMFHRTVVNEAYLRQMLADTGWEPIEWHTVDYTFVPRGFFVLAERSNGHA